MLRFIFSLHHDAPVANPDVMHVLFAPVNPPRFAPFFPTTTSINQP